MTEIPCWRLMMNQTEHGSYDYNHGLCHDCFESPRFRMYGDGTRCKACHFYCPGCDGVKPDEKGGTAHIPKHMAECSCKEESE
jgi:hypothetical protein